VINLPARKYFNTTTLNVILSTLLITIIGIDVVYAPMNRDAGAYLTVVKRMYQGEVPYRDFPMGYTPLALYFFMFVMKVIPIKNAYAAYLGATILVQTLSSLIFISILGKFGISFSKRLLCGSILLFSSLFLQGDLLVLEPFVVFFALLAVNELLKIENRHLSGYKVGVLAGLCVLSKQYGLLLLPALLVYCITLPQTLIRRLHLCLAVVSGLIFIVCGSALSFLYLYDLKTAEFIRLILGDGYIFHPVQFSTIPNALLFISPALFSVYVTSRITELSLRSFIVLNYTALLLFLTPLLIRSYTHYFILVLPWVLGLYACHFTHSGRSLLKSHRINQLAFSLASLVFSFFLICTCYRSGEYLLYKPRERQYSNSHLVDEMIPPGGKTAVFADPSLCFLTKSFLVTEIQCQRCGCGFYDTINLTQAEGLISNSDFLIGNDAAGSSWLYLKLLFESNSINFYTYLSEQGFKLNPRGNKMVQVWERKT